MCFISFLAPARCCTIHSPTHHPIPLKPPSRARCCVREQICLHVWLCYAISLLFTSICTGICVSLTIFYNSNCTIIHAYACSTQFSCYVSSACRMYNIYAYVYSYIASHPFARTCCMIEICTSSIELTSDLCLRCHLHLRETFNECGVVGGDECGLGSMLRGPDAVRISRCDII